MPFYTNFLSLLDLLNYFAIFGAVLEIMTLCQQLIDYTTVHRVETKLNHVVVW